MKAYNFVFAVLIVLVLASCFSPFRGPDASITINLGSHSRAAVYPPDAETFSRLAHTVELSGPTGNQSHELSEGKNSITISVEQGTWIITVKAFLDGEPYAEGSASTEVHAGEQAAASITMTRIKGPEYTGTSEITYEQITDASPDITGPTLRLSSTGADRTVTITFDDANAFDSITWEMNNEIYGEGVPFTLSVDPAPENSENYLHCEFSGTYVLTLIVIKGAVPYNKTFTFKVE